MSVHSEAAERFSDRPVGGKKRWLVRYQHIVTVVLGCSVMLGAAIVWPDSVSAADPSESVSASSSPADFPKIKVHPADIRLDGAADFQSFVAIEYRPDGITTDISDDVKWSLGDESIARIQGHQLFPVADGQTQLIGWWKGQSVSVSVTVHDAAKRQPVGFARDVIPVLTRAGCNSGSCHGASRGKDGFRLSLFGYDPAGDYQRITREMGVRRVNLAVPTESLLLRKAVGQVPHSGGKRIEPGSSEYQTLLKWLADGATTDTDDQNAATVQRLEVFPTEAVLQDAMTQRLIAVAHYSDGTTRDVSRLASWSSSQDRQAAVDSAGIVTAGQRGEAFVMARFDSHTVGAHVLTLPNQLASYQPPVGSEDASFIDQLVNAKLRKLRIPASPVCSDEEFLRRVTLDLIGLLPTREQYESFLADSASDKRARLIDQLVEREEFDQIWTMKFAQLLKIRSTNNFSRKSAQKYFQWLGKQFAERVPLDQIVRQLITGSGSTFTSPEACFYDTELDTLKRSENVAQLFLGIRTQCAQCHNHPFDRWTMDDYYGFAAFFAQVARKQDEDYREQIVFDRGKGETKHPLTKKPVPPKFLGGEAPQTKDKDRREVLASWLTDPENPFFAKSMANRVWAHLMGVGVVDPVDDIRVSNPPSNPALFEQLGQRLIDSGYDLRSLVRDICNSQTYQRSSNPDALNAHDHRNYSRATVRRIAAESLLDCISAVTDSPTKYAGLPMGSRAVEIPDGQTGNYFLTTFGRSPRTTVCQCEASTEPSLSQALNLINGTYVHNKVTGGKLVRRLLKESKFSPGEVIDEIYIRCLTRMPSEQEKSQLLETIGDDQKAEQALQDIFWAVLNGREFMFNH